MGILAWASSKLYSAKDLLPRRGVKASGSRASKADCIHFGSDDEDEVGWDLFFVDMVEKLNTSSWCGHKFSRTRGPECSNF